MPGRRRFPAGAADSPRLAAVMLAGVILITLTVAGGGLQRGPAQLVPLLACALVVVLRRWPLPVLAVVTAVVWLFTALGAASLPFGLLLGLTMFFSALGLPRPRSIALTLAVAAVLGATVVYSAFAVRTAQPAAQTTVIFVPLAGAWFIADSVAARRRYQAGLAAQAERERGAEVGAERVRIAREMHDVVAHALAVITVQAGVGRCLAAQRPEQASAALESIEAISRTAQDELRVVLGLLRDGAAGTAPLAPAPRLADVTDLADTVRAAGLRLDLRMEGTGGRLSPALELSVYRVMQEALTNVVKHAPGARAVAELTVRAGKVRLDVRNDGGPGRGPAAPPAGLDAGLGITGMWERVGAFGGWLVAGPAADGGFQVTAEIPIEGAAS
jgi:signal transduction histidine kinase